MQCSIVALVLFLLCVPICAQPIVTENDIELVRFNHSLGDLLSHLESQVKDKVGARDVLRQRRWEMLCNYYGFVDARKQLDLLVAEGVALRQLWKLKEALSAKGEATDVEVLVSRNAYLQKQVMVLQRRSMCREFLLELVRLSNLDLFRGDFDGQTQETHETTVKK